MTKKQPNIEHRPAFWIMWGVSIKRTHPVEDIAAMFGVSIPTIIRDLEQSQVRLSERLTQTLARAQARTHHHTS